MVGGGEELWLEFGEMFWGEVFVFVLVVESDYVCCGVGYGDLYFEFGGVDVCGGGDFEGVVGESGNSGEK